MSGRRDDTGSTLGARSYTCEGEVDRLAQQGDDRTALVEAGLRLCQLEAIVTALLLHDARDDGHYR